VGNEIAPGSEYNLFTPKVVEIPEGLKKTNLVSIA
jgi:hypothetical protein